MAVATASCGALNRASAPEHFGNRPSVSIGRKRTWTHSLFQEFRVIQDDLTTRSPERHKEELRFRDCAPFSRRSAC